MSRSLAVLFVSSSACADREPVETPFEGPGFDEATGLLVAQDEPFLVGITELHVKLSLIHI